MRQRASRNSVMMIGADDFLNFNAAAELVAADSHHKPSTSKGLQNVDPVAISEKVLLEAAREKGRVSEVMDREKIVRYTVVWYDCMWMFWMCDCIFWVSDCILCVCVCLYVILFHFYYHVWES